MNTIPDLPRNLSLTLGQLDFWEEFLAHPGQPVSTVAHVTRLDGDLNVDALAQAIRTMIAETDVLSLRFLDGNPPVQTVDPSCRPVLQISDLRGQPDPEGAARTMMQADIDAPLDLLAPPLSASWLMRVGTSRWLWYLRGHHIFLDGYSMALIERRVARLYAHLIGLADVGEPFGRLSAYLEEERRYQSSALHDKARAFWRAYLRADPPPASLAKGSEDYPAAALGAEIALDHLSAPLRHAADRFGLGWPDLLIVLAGLWLWHNPPEGTQGHNPRIAWLPMMGRMGSAAANIPAMALNIVPFRIAPDPQGGFGDTVTAMVDDLKLLRRHGRFRVEQMGRDLGLSERRRFFFSPLINVMPFDPARFAGCTTQREVLAAGPGDGFNITISATPRAEVLVMHLDADPVLTPPELFAAHVRGLPEFLHKALSAGPQTVLQKLF